MFVWVSKVYKNKGNYKKKNKKLRKGLAWKCSCSSKDQSQWKVDMSN